MTRKLWVGAPVRRPGASDEAVAEAVGPSSEVAEWRAAFCNMAFHAQMGREDLQFEKSEGGSAVIEPNFMRRRTSPQPLIPSLLRLIPRRFFVVLCEDELPPSAGMSHGISARSAGSVVFLRVDNVLVVD